MELFKDTLSSLWALVRPQLGKLLAILAMIWLIWYLLFSVLIPRIFPDSKDRKIDKLEQVVSKQDTTITVLEQVNNTLTSSNKQLQGAAEVTDAAISELIDHRGINDIKLEKNKAAANDELSLIRVDKALANEHTKILIERKAQQTKAGESVEATERLIEQSLAATKALDQKQARAVISSLWSYYDEVNK